MSSNKDTEWQQKVEETLIGKLKSALLISKGSGNIQLQRTVVYSIGEIGKVADNDLLLITVISLLESYMTSVPSLKVVAFMKVRFQVLQRDLLLKAVLKLLILSLYKNIIF